MDIEGSTALWGRAGDASTDARASHHALLRALFRQYGDHEVQPGTRAEGGDGFLAAFPGAGDALTCAIACQRTLAAHLWPDTVGPPRVRMALHTGDAHLQEGGYHGQALHYAQRMLLAAHGGQILCSESTAVLLRHDPGEGWDPAPLVSITARSGG